MARRLTGWKRSATNNTKLDREQEFTESFVIAASIDPQNWRGGRRIRCDDVRVVGYRSSRVLRSVLKLRHWSRWVRQARCPRAVRW